MEMRIIGLIVTLAWPAALAHAAGIPARPGGGPGGLFVEGRPAPALELPTVDGRATIRLDELRGSRVILLQFASW